MGRDALGKRCRKHVTVRGAKSTAQRELRCPLWRFWAGLVVTRTDPLSYLWLKTSKRSSAPVLESGTKPGSSMMSSLIRASFFWRLSSRRSSLASISSWTSEAAVVKPTDSPLWQAASPRPRATWVLPVYRSPAHRVSPADHMVKSSNLVDFPAIPWPAKNEPMADTSPASSPPLRSSLSA